MCVVCVCTNCASCRQSIPCILHNFNEKLQNIRESIYTHTDGTPCGMQSSKMKKKIRKFQQENENGLLARNIWNALAATAQTPNFMQIKSNSSWIDIYVYIFIRCEVHISTHLPIRSSGRFFCRSVVSKTHRCNHDAMAFIVFPSRRVYLGQAAIENDIRMVRKCAPVHRARSIVDAHRHTVENPLESFFSFMSLRRNRLISSQI